MIRILNESCSELNNCLIIKILWNWDTKRKYIFIKRGNRKLNLTELIWELYQRKKTIRSLSLHYLGI